MHPALEERLGRLPQIQVGVELAAQAFDVEQRLLQQHQLRLHFHVEAARGLKQPHQHQAQRNLAERAVEIRLAAGTDGAFELLHAGRLGRPARFDVQQRHAVVVTLEERQEVLRQVILVKLRQRPDDAEIQRDIAAEGLGRHAHQDVAGMHVGVEKAVAEDLREEDLHTVARQLVHVDAGLAQLGRMRDAHTVHALHHEHLGGAPVPEHLGHQQQVGVGEVAAQLAGVGGLAHQVEFIVQVLVELGDHLARLQALAVGPQLLHPRGHVAHQREIAVDHRQHAGAQHLHGHLAAIVGTAAQRGEVHLRDRGARHRMMVEAMEQRRQRLAQRPLDDGGRDLGVERRHAVLQLGQFVRHIGRQQVAARGQDLPELHEDRTELLQRQAQAFTARARRPAA